ncbi:MAG: RraA family protein [Dehalococcoidia bacterium]
MSIDAPLGSDDLDRLRALTSPTVANAIETFDLRARNQGFMGPEIRCFFPQREPMVAYAATAVVSARLPAGDKPRVSTRELWEHVLAIPEPRVLVVQDIDYPNPVGSYWGEVNGNIFKALGCVGTVTNGGVRDLDEVEAMGFYYFASAVLVSHAYIHLVDVGVPVEVGGLAVRPGDLLHGDKHGVTSIPLDIAKQVPEAAKRVEEQERRIIELCQSPGMTPEKFPEAMRQRR